jgi:hypothetical protein
MTSETAYTWPRADKPRLPALGGIVIIEPLRSMANTTWVLYNQDAGDEEVRGVGLQGS